jgi:uncharacterized membrane protein YhaH (DUF805 family)
MDDQSSVVEFSANPAKDIQLTMRRMRRREWWLWSYAIMITMLLLICIASFAFPALLPNVDSYYSFFLNQAVRGLVSLVLIFNVYVIYQQLQIDRIRRQLTDQVFAMDKVEVTALEVYRVALLDPLTMVGTAQPLCLLRQEPKGVAYESTMNLRKGESQRLITTRDG